MYTEQDPEVQDGDSGLQELALSEDKQLVENAKQIIMKLRILFCCTLICSFAFVASGCRSIPTTSGSDIPHLQKQGTATQLIVDGKPFLALAGELNNNSATSVEHMKPVWSKLVERKVNTVLAGVSWAQIEPREGKFDFSVLDGVIRDARSHNLRLVPLWFASWKNSLSSYPPDWVKRDFERFPRAQIVGGTWPGTTISEVPRTPVAGSMSIELLSPLSDANRDADARAFAALMRHIKEVDGQQHTVIMIQVENEVGMAGDSRDRSPLADRAYAGPVPKELMDYLQQHKDNLIPELRKVWEAAGFKAAGTWEEVFGPSRVTDGIFMAWYYARYIGRVVEAGKAEYPLPMFVNAALYGIGRGPQPPPSGGRPWDLVMDVWRAGAPRIDMLSPDIYSESDYPEFCAKYARPGNPLFIPETRSGQGAAARALYAFGRHDAIGVSPMGIDRYPQPDNDLTGSYDLLTQLAPLMAEHQGKGTMSAVLLRSPDDPPQRIQVGNYTLEVAFLNPQKTLGEPPPQGPVAAIFIAAGPDEYFAAGSGVTVGFSPNTPGPPHVGLATVEEGTFVNGRWVPGCVMAGDDDDEGQYVILNRPSGCCSPSTTTKMIQHITLYRYR